MDQAFRPRIKICCINSIEEASLAIRYGASALGLVSAMPSGPGPISEKLIATIAATIPPSISTFLLTSKQDISSIIQQQRTTRVNTVQICDRLVSGNYHELREAMPGVKIVQVIHVTGNESLDEAISVAPKVDALLLDSGNQSLKIKELGGTGRTHDWALSKTIRERINTPVFLAGGLHAGNVAEAINIVHPFGVDVCSGVRTNGTLDVDKLERFIHTVLNVPIENS